MLKVDQYEYVRTARRVYGKSVSEIARETGHSRNTVKKVLRGEHRGYATRERQAYPVLGPYLEIIDGWLEKDKDVADPRQRHTAIRVYTRLVREHGFEGSASNVRQYVREAKKRLGLKTPEAFIPLEPEPGVEAEVDWGTVTVMLDGTAVRVKSFCMRSKSSGKPFVRLYPCERQQAFLDGLARGFEFFGGVFPVVVFDNLTTAVEKILKGKGRVERESFSRFRAYASFDARFCNPGKGNEKGGVEGLVGFSRRNFLVPLPEGASLEQINGRLLEECVHYGRTHRIHGCDRTVDERHEGEKGRLLKLPEVPFSNEQTQALKTDKYATVIFDKNRYSVPTRYAGSTLRVVATVEAVEIYDRRERIARHVREYGNNKWRLDPDHYLELLKKRPGAFRDARPIRQWRKSWPKAMEALLERFQEAHGESRGIKEFIEVLLLFRTYTAEEVGWAVEEALAAGLSEGAGVRHLLQWGRGADETPLPLDRQGWVPLPPADVSVYAALGSRP